MDVKRYTLFDESSRIEPAVCSMRLDTGGDWVKATDLDAALARAEADARIQFDDAVFQSARANHAEAHLAVVAAIFMTTDTTDIVETVTRVVIQRDEAKRSELETQQQLASLKGYCEERAQELGWPGYSQGGDPAAYLFDHIVDLQQQLAGAEAQLKENEQYVREQVRHQEDAIIEAMQKQEHAESDRDTTFKLYQGYWTRCQQAEADAAAVRGVLEKALSCIEVQNMHSYDEQPDVETAIKNGYWCKMAMDARAGLLTALAQPRPGQAMSDERETLRQALLVTHLNRMIGFINNMHPIIDKHIPEHLRPWKVVAEATAALKEADQHRESSEPLREARRSARRAAEGTAPQDQAPSESVAPSPSARPGL